MARHRRVGVVTALLGGALMSLAPALIAQTQTDVLLYGSAISYRGSEVKEGGTVAGIYGSYGSDWKHFLEVGATRTGIDYLDGVRLTQTDVAVAYSRFGANGSARIGVHAIASSDVLTDGGMVLFGGASRYAPGVWSAGGEAAVSAFPDYEGGLVATQVTPSVGVTAYTGDRGVVGVTLRGYVVHLSRAVGLDGTDFFSAEAGLSFARGAVSISGYAWGGEQTFAVRNGGFTVFNLAELHTGGGGGSVRWVPAPRAALSASFYVERFRDLGFSGDAWARVFSLSAGFTL